MATVEVWIADLEPVTAFIVKVVQADAEMRLTTVEQAAELPDPLVSGWGKLQDAIRELGDRAPAEAAALMRGPHVVEHPV